MLVGRSVEHHLRVVHLKHFPHSDGVFHIGNDKSHPVTHFLEIRGVVHLELEVVHRRLGLVEHDEFGRVVMHYLTANLATDGACGTRHKHHLALDFANHIALTQYDRFASQKVLNLDVLDLVGCDFSVHPFVECGDGFHDEVERHALFDNFPAALLA